VSRSREFIAQQNLEHVFSVVAVVCSFSSAMLERGSQYELHPERHFKESEETQFVDGALSYDVVLF